MTNSMKFMTVGYFNRFQIFYDLSLQDQSIDPFLIYPCHRYIFSFCFYHPDLYIVVHLFTLFPYGHPFRFENSPRHLSEYNTFPLFRQLGSSIHVNTISLYRYRGWFFFFGGWGDSHDSFHFHHTFRSSGQLLVFT